MWYPGKRRKELKAEIARVEQIALIALHEARSVRNDFNSRFAEAIDRRYEFDEILMCMDDIMDHLNL